MGKLSNAEILSLYNAEGTYKDISKRFGVSVGCVCHIKTGIRHSAITGANGEERRREPNVSKEKRLEVYEYLTTDGGKTSEDASEYFGIPIHTIRRIKRLEANKYRFKRHV